THTIRQLPKDEYLTKLLAAENHYLLDIRTEKEYERGHLDGAENFNLLRASFGKQVAALDTTRVVFLYCETAHRSPFAAKKLKRVGFTRIYDLEGGYSSLRED
ncbi:MAG: rhodanese-like domain-containing protein, partial [Flavobacteriales bacterium]|nr:rhodanese-like domain-containing protein [Flavobacteriales bacterium]